MNKMLIAAGAAAALLLSGCSDSGVSITGKACMGTNNDTLIEGLGGQCKAGDTIATKHPAYFCDFHYPVAYNDYNSAICVYRGSVAEERIKPVEKKQ